MAVLRSLCSSCASAASRRLPMTSSFCVTGLCCVTGGPGRSRDQVSGAGGVNSEAFFSMARSSGFFTHTLPLGCCWTARFLPEGGGGSGRHIKLSTLTICLQ